VWHDFSKILAWNFINFDSLQRRRNNTMKIQILGRDFVYRGISLEDPDPKLSIEEIRSFYANQFPELTTTAITGPETVGDRLRYRFERAIGTKG
jgi:PRTRC genetic system protein C